MDCETFSACLTEEVPSLNQKASGKTSTVQQTLSDLSCKITDSTEQGADAVVTVNVTAVFPPNLISLYFSEMLLRQFDGDLVSSSANEVKEAGTERFDEMIFAPDVDRFSEELELSLRRIGNTWNIIPNDKFVSALSGFQDREATNNPSDE
ncbi:MAG: hypothetical protein LBS62_10020 [Clostridiales bacterium]|nr:hypothetical protein [Clostridiales bacterium]